MNGLLPPSFVAKVQSVHEQNVTEVMYVKYKSQTDMVTELIETSYLASMLKDGQFNFSSYLFNKFVLRMKIKANLVNLSQGQYYLSTGKLP